jgi:type VI protein secretion system component VasF
VRQVLDAQLDEPRRHLPAMPPRHRGAESRRTRLDDEKAPWHFKLMVVALVAYLGWRVVEIFN